MSNLSTSPGSRPVEQLKVAELRDELRKRGMSLKGVKKELFERLEEVIKKEEQDGIVDGKHRAALEGAHKTSISDEAEDFEEEDEALDDNIHDTTNAHPTGKLPSSCLIDLLPCLSAGDLLPKTCLSTTDEATPVSETHASSGVSAPDGVPGFNEDREHLSAASVASVGTNNDVLFVDNAVCENGDGMLSPPCVADSSEPGKESSRNQETRLEIATSDPKASETTDGAPESGFVVSDVMSASIENTNDHVAVDIVMSANDASGTGCAVHDVEKEILLAGSKQFAEQLSKSQTLIEPFPPTSLMQCTLDSGLPVDNSYQQKESGDVKIKISRVPLTDSTYKGLGKPIADERDIIVNQEKPNAIMEPTETHAGVREKHELAIAGEMEKSDVKKEPMEVDAGLVDKQKLISGGHKEVQIDVKVEPMEVDAGIEDTHKLISEGNKEIQNGKEDPFPTQRPSQVKEAKLENSSYTGGGRGDESRVQDKRKRTATDNTDLKSMQDDSQTCASLRRKDPDTDSKQHEPAKRMRRWNSGKEVTGDGLKPLTTDTVKEIILPKSMESSFVAPQRLTPKAGATSRELAPKASKVKLEPGRVNTRTVPPSTRAPSNSLKIERFVRPFTLKAVKDLLGEFGQCVDFWMDQIKTHCFVTYSSVNEAVAARNGLYGRQWPPSVGQFLVAEFVDNNEVKIRSEGAAEKAQPTAPLPNGNLPTPPGVVQSFRSGSTTFPPSRFSRETQFPPIPKKDPEPAGLTLEDLFFKTKAKPSIYYLPLTDGQVAEKLAATKKINNPPGSK